MMPARKQSGFMLLEVLVSILIFSLGVLALIGLQAKMTRAQTASKARADAGYLANELIGVIWSDTAHLSSYSSTGCAGYARCKDWQNKVAASLPGGVGAVTFTSASNKIDITITWTQSSDGSHTFTTSTIIVGQS
jgi:type IV pilus assembly protein PilV